MLLFHGSRISNYAGILSEGLRIAPPEAPVTGYMFDKGVYFADMASKSANYCHPHRSFSKGIEFYNMWYRKKNRRFFCVLPKMTDNTKK